LTSRSVERRPPSGEEQPLPVWPIWVNGLLAAGTIGAFLATGVSLLWAVGVVLIVSAITLVAALEIDDVRRRRR